jgi:hypothetical protein
VDRYSTKFEDSVSKRLTEITVVVAPDARREIEQLVDDEFLLDRDKILELFADLRRIDLDEIEKGA